MAQKIEMDNNKTISLSKTIRRQILTGVKEDFYKADWTETKKGGNTKKLEKTIKKQLQ